MERIQLRFFYWQMNSFPQDLHPNLDRMAKDYRTIRSNQPSRSSAEMREQLERNRLSYAKRPQSPSALPLSSGLKRTV